MKSLAGIVLLAGCCSLFGCAQAEDGLLGGIQGEGGSGGAGTEMGSGGFSGHGGASDGGSGGQGGSGGSGGDQSSGGDGGVGGGSPNLCGNGVRDADEACDGVDFGGTTCESLGLGPGALLCNGFCGIVASGCKVPEQCNDSQDNDQDALYDCDDPDCDRAPSCTDSCAAPFVAVVPSFVSGDTTGKASVRESSCAPASGNEVFFQIEAPATGTLKAELSSSAGLVVSIRTDCSNDASELGCKVQTGFGSAIAGAEVTQGQTVFVMIDGSGPENFGWFSLSLDMPPPEGGVQCGDTVDNDADGYLDCDDPTACQGSSQCAPGATGVGAACFFHSECAANQGDPICLSDLLGFPSGYCSEFCDVAAPDCAGDAVCADLGMSVHGVCLDSCSSDAQCRPGYACVDKGLSSNVCLIAPEASCNDWLDNDHDGLIDCEDADKCQTLADCTPGPAPVGSPCSQSNQCAANANDPICLTEPLFGYPSGYCSEFCNPVADDCGSGGLCVNWFGLTSGNGTCFDLCTSPAECRFGYDCIEMVVGQKICTPQFFF